LFRRVSWHTYLVTPEHQVLPEAPEAPPVDAGEAEVLTPVTERSLSARLAERALDSRLSTITRTGRSEPTRRFRRD
jgi:hypothetical protein